MKEKNLIFQNGVFFLAKQCFLQISANFLTGFEIFFLYLKVLQTRMKIYANNFLVGQMVPEIYA